MTRGALLAAVLAAGSGGPAAVEAAAQESPVIGGQVRPRHEFRGWSDRPDRSFTTIRTRLSVLAPIGPDARAFVQFQDVRVWGEESSTLDGQANLMDLHQGFVELGHEGRSPLWLRVGRQEVRLAEERLVGTVDWSQVGRSFDGVRAALPAGERVRVDLLGSRVRYSETFATEESIDLLGAWATAEAGEGRSATAYLLHERFDDRFDDGSRSTLGLHYQGDAGALDYRLESAWQTTGGDLDDVSAWLLAARAGVSVAGGRGGITVWYDILSGDADSDGDGAFDTLYATNHKFYGYADLFTNIPMHTDGRGLQDAAAKLSWGIGDGFTAGLDVHHFRVAEADGLDEGRLAEELDATLRWQGGGTRSGLSVLGGLSWVRAGETLAGLRGPAVGQNQTFAYVQLSAGF